MAKIILVPSRDLTGRGSSILSRCIKTIFILKDLWPRGHEWAKAYQTLRYVLKCYIVYIHYIHKWPPCNFEKCLQLRKKEWNNMKYRVKMSHCALGSYSHLTRCYRYLNSGENTKPRLIVRLCCDFPYKCRKFE